MATHVALHAQDRRAVWDMAQIPTSVQDAGEWTNIVGFLSENLSFTTVRGLVRESAIYISKLGIAAEHHASGGRGSKRILCQSCTARALNLATMQASGQFCT